jgi:hypothetical protein
MNKNLQITEQKIYKQPNKKSTNNRKIVLIIKKDDIINIVRR